jgi:hypothetical protein
MTSEYRPKYYPMNINWDVWNSVDDAFHKKIKTPLLRPVAEAFVENLKRAWNTMFLSTALIDIASDWGSCHQSILNEMKENGGGGFSYPRDIHIRLAKLRKKRNEADADNKQIRLNEIVGIMDFLSKYMSPWAPQGFDGIMQSIVVQAWTTFETLSGDLWISSLNAHPHGLSHLDGKPKRIRELAKSLLADAVKSKPQGSAASKEGNEEKGEKEEKKEEDKTPQAKRQDEGRMIQIQNIHDVTNGTYNLSDKMGELLKDKINFTSLDGIREAYSLAFNPKRIKKSVVDAVDSALAGASLDALAAVRHVIVHKAGVADEDYVKAHKKLPEPLRVKDQQVPLDATFVRELVEPVVERSHQLLTAVDEWIAAEKGGK